MNILLSFILLFAILISIRVIIYLVQNWLRKSASRVESDEKIILEKDGFGLKIMSNKTIPGGPVAGKVITTIGRMVLTDKRLLVASNQGRVLEINAERNGCARSVGPKRLVVLGKHASGGADLRLEMTIEEETQWADLINERFTMDDADKVVFP